MGYLHIHQYLQRQKIIMMLGKCIINRFLSSIMGTLDSGTLLAIMFKDFISIVVIFDMKKPLNITQKYC